MRPQIPTGSRAHQVRILELQGLKVREVADLLGLSTQRVYAIREQAEYREIIAVEATMQAQGAGR